MVTTDDPPAVYLTRERIKGTTRVKPVRWCLRCEWQQTRRASRMCADCDPTAHTHRSVALGLHLRRVVVARLLADRGPTTASRIAFLLRFEKSHVFRAVSASAAFVAVQGGYTLTPLGHEMLQRYEGGGE